ncbi:MAG: VWA domain-containing protein, partial [Acidobacteria bacterium]|nr:VWA domain-containing protein [Acidobacteriota bacterium]
LPKDITFVADTSGSMTEGKLDQARKALLFCLDNLNSQDRFEVIRFSTEAQALFGRLQPASPDNLSRARVFAAAWRPIGGTNIDEALTLALNANRQSDARPRFVIFITDGKPTIGETGEDALLDKVRRANTSATRIFTFGIGDDLNTHLLDRITEETKAYRTYVRNNEDLELKISSFYQKIKTPVLVDLKLDVEGAVKTYQTYPRSLPDLFEGSQLLVFGRYSGGGRAVVRLSGSVQGRPRSFEQQIDLPSVASENAFLAPLWATQRIGYLLDQLRLHGEEHELIDEVTQLARRFGIITPYTSYLIVEDEAARITRNELTSDRATFGAAPGAASPANRQKAAEEYRSMQQKSGASSVTASSEVEALKQAQNYGQIFQGKKRLDYTDKDGKVQNLASQTKNVQGRAIYQAGNFWVDSKIQTLKQQQARRIQFGTTEYYALLDKEPQSAQFLALGRNVRFAIGEVAYEVYE